MAAACASAVDWTYIPIRLRAGTPRDHAENIVIDVDQTCFGVGREKGNTWSGSWHLETWEPERTWSDEEVDGLLERLDGIDRMCERWKPFGDGPPPMTEKMRCLVRERLKNATALRAEREGRLQAYRDEMGRRADERAEKARQNARLADRNQRQFMESRMQRLELISRSAVQCERFLGREKVEEILVNVQTVEARGYRPGSADDEWLSRVEGYFWRISNAYR